MCCRKGGTVSIPGVYIGFPDKIPMGAAMNKGLTFKMGQTHVQRYTEPLLEKVQSTAQIDPSFVITHEVPLERGARGVQDLPRQEGPAASRSSSSPDDCRNVPTRAVAVVGRGRRLRERPGADGRSTHRSIGRRSPRPDS